MKTAKPMEEQVKSQIQNVVSENDNIMNKVTTDGPSSVCVNHSVTCDIFIRSYYKDLDWLVYCLASIEKFCSGFRSVVVVVPRSTKSRLRKLGNAINGVRVELCKDYRDDYLGQQVTKLHADHYTDAKLICHVDSDCIFTNPITPSDLMNDGKIQIIRCPIASMGRHRPWWRPTEKFLGWEVRYDFMQHPPFTYPCQIYREVRNHSFEVHGIELEEYVTSCPPREFSEFNVLGAYAYTYHYDWFKWADLVDVDVREQKCRWYWSWGGVTSDIRREIESILAV